MYEDLTKNLFVKSVFLSIYSMSEISCIRFFCINIFRLTFLERWIGFMKKVSAKIYCVLSYYVCNNFKDDGR